MTEDRHCRTCFCDSAEEAALVGETWRGVPGYEGRYEVSDAGRVRSWIWLKGADAPLVLRCGKHKYGYPLASLSKDGKRTAHCVHALVALAFIGPRPLGMEVRHLDGDPTNNTLANLAYGTVSQNQKDSVLHGTNASIRRAIERTHCRHGHALTSENVFWSRGARYCRICRRKYDLARRSALRATQAN